MSTFTPTPQQDQAIKFAHDMVVVARPGSGKTSVLSHKVRRLLSEVRAFQGIIAISFTNKASEELEHRCKAQGFDVKQSFFGTIDEFCLREIIRPFARQLMHVAPETRTAKLAELPGAVRLLLPALQIQSSSLADTVQFLPFLQAALTQGYIPLETVGMLACRIVDLSPACQRYLKARYRAVFIDEYQDSGYFQHQLFLKLKAQGLTAVAVGDGDQSIFAFAHKDPQYLLALTQPGSGFTAFPITINFRSHPSISDFALRLLDANHPLAPTTDMRVFLKTVTGDQIAIAHWLRTAIPHLMSHFHVAAADRVAILCRHQHSARLFAEHLGLPHHLFEDSPFSDTPSAEANLFSDLLKLRFDPQLTAQTLLERRGAPGWSPTAMRTLRQVLLRCRTCTDSDLGMTVMDAATRLLGQPLSAVGATELQAVCGDSALRQRFASPARNAVQIMTLHKAKGLEFDLVFHADLYDHVVPTRRYPPGRFGEVIFENEKQCLNLHYVGVTRAIHACVLLTSTSRINTQGQPKNGAPSQFLGRHGTTPTPITW
ncbi:DNA/RNA helicase (plasmid) [Cupriavidus necator]|uniref:DNA 3'-5' helicase n=1 Tax=Cupriavidus necator TaxID=106590 RepID=A0A1U9V2U0_CUPNE|nr:ATP-dependent helicase [Cupriavidus necator]AQV99264.1 DNA/RNA helicase [Cupriavidus necator]